MIWVVSLLKSKCYLGFGLAWDLFRWLQCGKEHLLFLNKIHLVTNCQKPQHIWVFSWQPGSHSPDFFCFCLELFAPSSPWGSSVHGGDVSCSCHVSLCPTHILLYTLNNRIRTLTVFLRKVVACPHGNDDQLGQFWKASVFQAGCFPTGSC